MHGSPFMRATSMVMRSSFSIVRFPLVNCSAKGCAVGRRFSAGGTALAPYNDFGFVFLGRVPHPCGFGVWLCKGASFSFLLLPRFSPFDDLRSRVRRFLSPLPLLAVDCELSAC